MNGKKAREIRKAIKALDAQYVAVPVQELKKVYKDLKKAYTNGTLK